MSAAQQTVIGLHYDGANATTDGMSNDANKTGRFRVSLKVLLLVLLAIGAGFGLLGRLLRHDPRMFSAVVGVLSTIVPYVLAVGTILWMGRKRRQFGLLAWGIFLILLPFIGFGVMALTQMYAGPSPGNLGMQSNADIINKQLPTRIEEPWVWQELERRLAARSLSKEEAESAVGKLIAHMKASKPNGWDRPLNWQSDFLKSASKSGLLSDQLLADLSDAYYGPTAKIQPLKRLREANRGFDIDIQYGSNWASDTVPALLWQVDRVLLDGQPIEFKQNYRNSRGWSSKHEGKIAKGDHDVTCEITCAYVDRSKLIGLNVRRLPATRWPKPIKKWKQTISAPLTVFDKDASLVQLTNDTELDPTGEIKVKRCVVQADEGNSKKIFVELDMATGASSWDVSVVLAGKEIPLGYRWAFITKGRSSSGGPALSAKIKSLDPGLEVADIKLTPAPKHIEHMSEVKEIWGKPITIFSVDLERLDLEVGSQSDADQE